MNHVQAISRRILKERLKLQLGLHPNTDIDYTTLRAMLLQIKYERRMQRAQTEAALQASAG
jgi:hypothetical protein